MANMIKLAPGLSFDAEEFACEVSAAIGNRGGGKSNGCAVAVEQLLDARVQVIILDYVGIWFALRLRADGKTPSSYDVPILGGCHGDVELSAQAGAVVAEALAERRTSCILDLSLFSKSDRARFATDFAETFFRAKKQHRGPSLIVLEEAQRFVPQRVYKGQERMLGAFEEIAEVGRNFGIGLFLISQRPQNINKSVLNLADNLFAYRTIGTHERQSLEEWVQEKGADGQRDIGSALPGLPTGTCYAWSPTRHLFGKYVIRLKSTYDSGATPLTVQKNVAPKALDLEELVAAMGKAVDASRKGTPSTMAGEVSSLRRQVAALQEENARLLTRSTDGGGSKAPPGVVKAIDRAMQLVNSFWGDLVSREAPKIESVARQLSECRVQVERMTGVASRTPPSGRDEMRIVFGNSRKPTGSPRSRDQAPAGWERVSLSAGELRILTAVAQHGGQGEATREQLTVICGYKRSSRDTYLQRLRSGGLVTVEDDRFVCTPRGDAHLGPNYRLLPTGADLLAYWMRELPEGERKILELAASQHPGGVSKDLIESALGYKRSSRDTYIQRLRARQLVTVREGTITASEMLFD